MNMRHEALLGIVLLVVLGCDRTPRVHLEGRMRLPEGASSALVFPLDGARRAFVVDPKSGQFAGGYGARNVDPRTIPLFGYIANQPPFVLLPGRDFTLAPEGSGLRVDLDLDPANVRPAKPLPLACRTDWCTADLPGEAARCLSTVVVLDGDKTTLVAPGGEKLPGGGMRLMAFFPVSRHRSRALVIVTACADHAYVSEVATFDGP